MNPESSCNKNGETNPGNESDDSDDNQPPVIPYRRDRTPSIVVQSLGLSFHKDSNITESIELSVDDDDNDNQHDTSQNSNSSENEPNEDNVTSPCDNSDANYSILNATNTSPVGSKNVKQNFVPATVNKPAPNFQNFSSGRRLSLNIGSTAPRRQSLTVDGLSSFVNPASKDLPINTAGNATGSLRNKVALKPGHSLMGWIKLASSAKDLSGTNGKIIEVNPEELARHDKETDCWVALKGNVYNVTTYLQYHPGGVEELMRGAGRDATELFNEVHRWVNYESLLAKCLIGPYKPDSPSTPVGRAGFATMTMSPPPAQTNKSATGTTTNSSNRDPTVAQKPPRRQSIALTVPSPNKYQSLLLRNNSTSNVNQIQQAPTYVIMQDKTCIKLKVQDLTTIPLIRCRNLICDLNEKMELHLSIILSSDWLYRVHLRLDQQIDENIKAELSGDEGTVTIQLNKKQPTIWNKIGTSLDLNDSLCEMTLADKFFRPCRLLSKSQLTHDTYLFEFKLESSLMYIPIGWHVLLREYLIPNTDGNKTTNENEYEDYRVHKNYTPVLPNMLENDGLTDESGFMKSLFFIIKLYPNGMLTSKIGQLKIGDSVDISDYQTVDFDIEAHVLNPKHWFLFAAGTGITPFCRTISYLLNQNESNVKSVNLVFFNKNQNDIIWRDQFDDLSKKYDSRFKVTHVLSEEPQLPPTSSNFKPWLGKRGKVNKDLFAELVDSYSPDELQLLVCGPKAFTQLTKSIATELNLNEKLYIFHG